MIVTKSLKEIFENILQFQLLYSFCNQNFQMYIYYNNFHFIFGIHRMTSSTHYQSSTNKLLLLVVQEIKRIIPKTFPLFKLKIEAIILET